MLWAYDKGALAPHVLPHDAGFRHVLAATTRRHRPLRLATSSHPCLPSFLLLHPRSVGVGTKYTTLLLQIHYQIPATNRPHAQTGSTQSAATTAIANAAPSPPPLRASDLLAAGYRDTSGIRVTLASTLRPLDAWSFEFMAYNSARTLACYAAHQI